MAMCVEFKTGTVKWEERSIGPSFTPVADGRIYVHAESGDVALFEPSAEGYREKGRFTPPGCRRARIRWRKRGRIQSSRTASFTSATRNRSGATT